MKKNTENTEDGSSIYRDGNREREREKSFFYSRIQFNHGDVCVFVCDTVTVSLIKYNQHLNPATCKTA